MAAGIVRSERHRVVLFAGLLMAMLGLLAWVLTGPVWVAPELLPGIRRSAPLMFGVLATMLVYEGVVWRWLGQRAADTSEPSTVFRWANAAVEASFVTVILALGTHSLGPAILLSGSLPWAYFPILALTALNLNARLCAFSGLVAAVGYGAVAVTAVGAFEPVPSLPLLTSPHNYFLKSIFLLLSGLASGFVASRLHGQLLDSLRTARERDRAVSIFGQHVSPQVAERLLNQPIELTGEERQVCVMFLDIRDFSRLAAEQSPVAVMEYLNRLFGAMIQVVNAHHGIVNKFLGDGFMAVFGAPLDDAQLGRNAVNCACELLHVTAELSRTREIPPTRLGIGLHLGQAVTGNVGSELRKEYTVIGDTVNLAARIEQATKTLHSQLLVSEALWSSLPFNDLAAEDLGPVELKGQPLPIRLFKLA